MAALPELRLQRPLCVLASGDADRWSSRSPVELDLPGRQVGGLVRVVVGTVVVPGAQGDPVSEVGVAAVDPAGLVVGVESEAAVAALGAAAPVADEQRDPLRL